MSDILCPKCGGGTQWSCHGNVGLAHCHNSGLTSCMHPRGWKPTCDWSGSVVSDGDTVRLATDADKDFIDRENWKELPW